MRNPNWRKCVLRADSREIIKRIPDNSIDFILTDPPYNIGKHSTGNIPLPGRTAMNNDVAEWDLEDFNPEEWAGEFIRILKPTGNIFIFTSYNQIGRWHSCLDHRFDTTNFMIWHKTNPAPKIYKAGFLNSCEMIFTCWNKGHTWNFISQTEMHNFIESPICMRPERLSNPKHPTQKPISILKKMISIASNEDDIIFDPFMGVGSTGVAALKLNRRFIGIELNQTYFTAAKQRIELMIDKQKETDHNTSMVQEPVHSYQRTLFSITELFANTQKEYEIKSLKELSPIIKWAGGKEKELKYIIPNVPLYNRFIEPFVGGGSVFTAMTGEKLLINDLSPELIHLYENIAKANPSFYSYAEAIDISWTNARDFFSVNKDLVNLYLEYREEKIDKTELKGKIQDFCALKEKDITNILTAEFQNLPSVLVQEMEINLYRKMLRIKTLEQKKHTLSSFDLEDNIETAIKSAVYMNYRYLYNDKHISFSNSILHSALFLFIRNYAYSGMFRYNDKGEFNVPYGGIGYNTKTMKKKLDYYRSSALLNHFKKTQIYNLDFELFLRNCSPRENDFVFLDPPYDSEFNTYAQNEFTHKDQIRLANYMINECKAKWMLIIKNTDFIYSLYNKKGIKIQTFDKEYLVSFMNRNDKKVTHLLITNY